MKFHDVIIGGEKFSFPSSTSIISLARERGYLIGDQWLTYNEETLINGTKAHKLIEYIMRGNNFTSTEEKRKEWFALSEAMKNVLRGVIRWQRATGYKSRQSEFEVVSATHGFVGHPDDIGTIKQHINLVDWTTGKLNTGKRIQLGSYYLAYLEQYPKKTIYEARGVELSKETGNYSESIISEPELQQLAQDFIAIKTRIGVI